MKCRHKPNSLTSFMGIEVDSCTYDVTEVYRNCTVVVSKCPKCGAVDIGWLRQEDTEQIDPAELL